MGARDEEASQPHERSLQGYKYLLKFYTFFVSLPSEVPIREIAKIRDPKLSGALVIRTPTRPMP